MEDILRLRYVIQFVRLVLLLVNILHVVEQNTVFSVLNQEEANKTNECRTCFNRFDIFCGEMDLPFYS